MLKSSDRLISRRTTVVCLVVAPLLEVLEAALSPLADTSTKADVAAVAAHQQVFVASVLVGMVATALYVPAFLGLAAATVVRSRRLARAGGWLVVGSLLGFFGVRMGQAVELQAVRDGLPASLTARLIDDLATNPLGVVVLVLFLGGSTLGVIALAASAWRAGLPRLGAVLLGAFPLADLALHGHLGTLASHLVLLAGLVWLAVGLQREAAGAGLGTAPVPATP